MARKEARKGEKENCEMDKKSKAKEYFSFVSLHVEICLNVFKVTWRRTKKYERIQCILIVCT